MVSPNRKGGAFERKCGRLLSDWLTGGEDDSQLIRSVQSGGWDRRRVRQVGDLAPNGPRGEEFRLSVGVECKKRESFQWRHTWTSEDPDLVAWWRKHFRECREADLMPMILYRKNYHPLLVGTPVGALAAPRGPRLVLHHGPHSITFSEWEDFSALRPDDVIREAAAWSVGT